MKCKKITDWKQKIINKAVERGKVFGNEQVALEALNLAEERFRKELVDYRKRALDERMSVDFKRHFAEFLRGD